MKFKKKIKIAIDSPAAAGAGTQARLISKHYNLFFLDTGKIYRLLGLIKIKNPKKISFLNLQSLYKLLPQDDHIYVDIAKKFTNCQFWFLEKESEKITNTFKKRISDLFEESNLSLNKFFTHSN